MEVVGTEDMPTKTPAVGEALVGHVGRADSNVVDRADIPAAMVQARTLGLHECDHVMVATVDAMHEGNEIAGSVRQAKPEHVVIERDRLRDILGESQDMCEPARLLQIGKNSFYSRSEGEVLHKSREPIEILESLKGELGSYTFAAQYQQRPIPPGGGSIKATWIRRYATLPEGDSTQVILSLDTASKDGCENDWSVCTAWLLQEEKYYLIDVMRIRADYPTLKERINSFTKVHKPTKILIEDCGVGTALIAELKMVAQCLVVAVKPEHDKKTRIAVQAAKFESGQVYFPEEASWLEDLEEELFSFPHSRNDDQVDSISQALAHAAAGLEFDTTLSWV